MGSGLVVMVTGADHVWGQLTAEAALAAETMVDATGTRREVARVVLPVHHQPYDPQLLENPRVEVAEVSITDEAGIAKLIEGSGVTSVVHFETVTVDRDGGDADIEHTVRTNVLGSWHLLEALRRSAPGAGSLVFCSSCAVFEDDADTSLTSPVSEATRRRPATLYGATKAAVELLVDAYGGRGDVDARAAVLPMNVSWRPDARNADFLNDVIGAVVDAGPLTLGVEADRKLFLNGYETCIANLFELHDLPAAALGSNRTLLQPGIVATPAEMVDSLRQAARERGHEVGEVTWQPDAGRAQRLGQFPSRVDDSRARGLGLSVPDLGAITRRHLEDLLAAGIASQ